MNLANHAGVGHYRGTMKFTAPDFVTSIRFVAIPFLIGFAWLNMPMSFLVTAVLALLSDTLDGYLARKLHVVSEQGARLDSFADLSIYLVLAASAPALWPHIARREAWWLIAGAACYSITFGAGYARFRRLTCYHSHLSKIAAIILPITSLTMILTDIVWPFHVSVMILFVSAVDDVLITVLLREWRPNVPSFLHALRKR